MRFQDQSFQQRERSILDSALRLFHEQPWDRLTIAELAEHAGIGKGTLYKHFPSKEALYAHLVLEFSTTNLQTLRDLAGPLGSGRALRQVIREAFRILLADPVMTQLWMHCDRPDFRQRLSSPYREQFATLDQDYQQFFLDLLLDSLGDLRLSEADALSLLWALDASVLGVMARIASGSLSFCEVPFEVEQYLDRISDFIVAGLHGQAAQFSPSSAPEKV